MLLLFNARSLVNKVTELEHLLLSRSPSVVIVTETWLNNDIPNDVVVPPGYRVFRWDRNSRGGGVAIVIKNVSQQFQLIAIYRNLYGVNLRTRTPITLSEPYTDHLPLRPSSWKTFRRF